MMRLLLSVFCGLLSLPLAAHVRWFVDEQSHGKPVSFSFDTLSQFIVIGALWFLLGCYYLQHQTRYQPLWRLLHQPLRSSNQVHWPIAAGLVAFTLMSNVCHGIAIAPNLNPNSLVTVSLLLIQAASFFMFFINLLWAGILLMSALTIILFNQPWWLVIDYFFEFGAIALAIIFAAIAFKVKNSQQQHKYMTVAISVLRIGLGVQLMILAVHNKLLNPELGLEFLRYHGQFNFMLLLGFEQFSHLHFVLAAGIAELCFGLLLTFNIATRIVSAIVVFCFAVTGLMIGGEELVGHMPIFAINLLLIFYGSNGSAPAVAKTLVCRQIASKMTSLSLQR